MFSTAERKFIKEIMIEAMEDCGLITPYLTRQEVIKQIGRHRYEKAIRSGIIYRHKAEGRNANVRIRRKEFTELLNNGKI